MSCITNIPESVYVTLSRQTESEKNGSVSTLKKGLHTQLHFYILVDEAKLAQYLKTLWGKKQIYTDRISFGIKRKQVCFKNLTYALETCSHIKIRNPSLILKQENTISVLTAFPPLQTHFLICYYSNTGFNLQEQCQSLCHLLHRFWKKIFMDPTDQDKYLIQSMKSNVYPCILSFTTIRIMCVHTFGVCRGREFNTNTCH